MERTLNCELCGERFVARAKNAKYCLACRKQERARRSAKSHKPKVDRPPVTRNTSSIVEMNRMARESGLTYGQLVAMIGGE